VTDDEGMVATILDRKSDVSPSSADRAKHAGQLSENLSATGAQQGAVVDMNTGEIVWL